MSWYGAFKKLIETPSADPQLASGEGNTEKSRMMTTEERDRFIAQKLDEGLSLSDVQALLAKEHGINLTYLELRLIAADLKVNWKKQDKAAAAEKKAVVALDAGLDEPPSKKQARTKVSVSKLVRPGAAMSGEVEFASGAKAEWFVDAMGRLGLHPAPGSARPTEEDIQDFQVELQRKLGGGGY